MSDWLRINLSFPAHLETTVCEALSSDPRMPGFTLLRAEGHSSDFALASAGEQVRGRVERRLIWMLVPLELKQAVLDVLATGVDSRELHWWTEPVLEMGRMG
ncbi:DUF3240 family protein [Luteimonas sp. e5]